MRNNYVIILTVFKIIINIPSDFLKSIVLIKYYKRPTKRFLTTLLRDIKLAEKPEQN